MATEPSIAPEIATVNRRYWLLVGAAAGSIATFIACLLLAAVL